MGLLILKKVFTVCLKLKLNWVIVYILSGNLSRYLDFLLLHTKCLNNSAKFCEELEHSLSNLRNFSRNTWEPQSFFSLDPASLSFPELSVTPFSIKFSLPILKFLLPLTPGWTCDTDHPASSLQEMHVEDVLNILSTNIHQHPLWSDGSSSPASLCLPSQAAHMVTIPMHSLAPLLPTLCPASS